MKRRRVVLSSPGDELAARVVVCDVVRAGPAALEKASDRSHLRCAVCALGRVSGYPHKRTRIQIAARLVDRAVSGFPRNGLQGILRKGEAAVRPERKNGPAGTEQE